MALTMSRAAVVFLAVRSSLSFAPHHPGGPRAPGRRTFDSARTRSWLGADPAGGRDTRRAAGARAPSPAPRSATTEDLLAGLRARAEDLRRAEDEEARREELRPTALSHAWVVLFRGDASGDGIHSLSSRGREIVLAFESVDEARRFALVLKAQGFYEPTPHRMSIAALEDFTATDDRIDLLQVPEGTCIVPPEDAVADVDFAPNLDENDGAAAVEEAGLSEAQLTEAKARLEVLFGA